MDSLPSTSFTITIYNIKSKNSKFFIHLNSNLFLKIKQKKPKISFVFVPELD
jgi:quinolinate synthase